MYIVQCDDKVCARSLSFVLTTTWQVHNVVWLLDGTRLVAVTEDGSVILVTNNNAHETVYKANTAVRTLFAFLSLLIPCLVVWMRIQP